MEHVAIGGDLVAGHSVVRLATSLGLPFRLQGVGTAAEPRFVQIEPAPFNPLFLIASSDTVRVSTWQAEGISRYAGVTRETFLLLGAVLGLAQLEALRCNPALRPEDFVHDMPSDCLYVPSRIRADLALALESPYVCPGCLMFYRCLMAEPETQAILAVLDHIRYAPEDRKEGQV